MEKSKIKALLLAAAIVTPNLVALVAESAVTKHVDEFSNEQLRDTLRALNCTTDIESQTVNEFPDERS